jgi:putative transposase
MRPQHLSRGPGKRYPYVPARNQRLDAQLYAEAGRVCFFTVRAYRGSRPFLDDRLAATVARCICEERTQSHCLVYAYCLMPDHLHLLVTPERDRASVLRFVDRLKGRTTREAWALGWSGKLWQPRSYDHILRKAESVIEAYRYIIHNPVRKGLVASPGDWRSSGAADSLP